MSDALAPSGGRRLLRFGLAGIVSGLVSAGSWFVPLDRMPGFRVLGLCVGVSTGSDCSGLDAALYLGPGLVFGCALATLLRGDAGPAARAALLIAATAANAAAVFVCTGMLDPLAAILGDNTGPFANFALAGCIAAAVGGGALAVAIARLTGMRIVLRATATGALLGLLLPVVFDELDRHSFAGVFAFYALWQGGYAFAIATSPRRA